MEIATTQLCATVMALSTAWLWVAVAAVGLVLSACYSGIETGTYAINKMRLELLSARGNGPAERIRHELARPGMLFSTLLVGNNIANYMFTFSLSALLLRAGSGMNVEWQTLLIATPLLFIFGESVPKHVFHRLSETLVPRLSWFLTGSRWVFTLTGLGPLVWGFSALLTRLTGAGDWRGSDYLSAMLTEGRASGVLTHQQASIAGRVVGLSQTRLAEVMVPMSQVVGASVEVDRQQLKRQLFSHDYSRLPLFDSTGRIRGILNVYDALMGVSDAAPASLSTRPMALEQSLNVTDALYRMQRAHVPMVVVQDEQGRQVGIATVKDLVEEIVGELAAW